MGGGSPRRIGDGAVEPSGVRQALKGLRGYAGGEEI